MKRHRKRHPMTLLGADDATPSESSPAKFLENHENDAMTLVTLLCTQTYRALWVYGLGSGLVKEIG
jgi:hypothetical protein